MEAEVKVGVLEGGRSEQGSVENQVIRGGAGQGKGCTLYCALEEICQRELKLRLKGGGEQAVLCTGEQG